MIDIIITKEDINRCHDFAKAIIQTRNQYNRFHKNQSIQIERTFIGKIAEYIFLRYLNEYGKDFPESVMFDIFEGQENVDSFDFKTKFGHTVDIKTASKSFHQRIMVPITQWHLEKDYYVGIRIHTESDGFNGPIILDSISKATIYGFCNRKQIGSSQTKNYGDGPCKHYLLTDLNNIERLLDQF